MEILLLRHAQTSGNLSSQYIGHTDQPLCTEGITLADVKKKDFTVKKVYTSSLKRTIQTAEILYPNAEIYPVEDLSEMNFGRFEEKNYRDLEECEEYSV